MSKESKDFKVSDKTDELLIRSLPDINGKPASKVSLARKKMIRLLIGITFNVFTLSFFNLNYILPIIGICLLINGFRALRNENIYFKSCWIISIIRLLYFLSTCVIQATIWSNTFSSSSISHTFAIINILSIILQILLMGYGFRSIQQKSNLKEHGGCIAALVIWYALLGLIAYFELNHWFISVITIISYCFIIKYIYRLINEITSTDYSITISPIRLLDKILCVTTFTIFIGSIIIAYIFFNKYPMKWKPLDIANNQETQMVKSHLVSIGFPEDIINDITDEDISICKDAKRVIVTQNDYPVNQGREVETNYDGTDPKNNYQGGTITDTVYDKKELRTTSIIVELQSDNNDWKIFHHFEWVEKTPFYGTEVIQVWPSTMRNLGWELEGNFSGQILYNDAGKTYVSPYHTVENNKYSGNISFYDNPKFCDILASFSFPYNKEKYRGYISYNIKGLGNSRYISSWFNYLHQYRLQYPVQTALEYQMQPHFGTSGSPFVLVQDLLDYTIIKEDSKTE